MIFVVVIHHVFFRKKFGQANLGEYFGKRIPNLYSHDHQGFCFDK